MTLKSRGRLVRRNRSQLEAALAAAQTQYDKALAHYRLGLFHDNNSREAEAVPHYETAIELGLPHDTEAHAFAWLASSLHKTGFPDRALGALQRASALTTDSPLQRFLGRLERRIGRSRSRNRPS
jgi:tetratricopeptide (TPR) repeat protein